MGLTMPCIYGSCFRVAGISTPFLRGSKTQILRLLGPKTIIRLLGYFESQGFEISKNKTHKQRVPVPK